MCKNFRLNISVFKTKIVNLFPVGEKGMLFVCQNLLSLKNVVEMSSCNIFAVHIEFGQTNKAILSV